MQKDLQDLKPRLIETSQETEELIATIEKETLEVEEVKKVVEADEAAANKAAAEAQAIKVGSASLFPSHKGFSCTAEHSPSQI